MGTTTTIVHRKYVGNGDYELSVSVPGYPPSCRYVRYGFSNLADAVNYGRVRLGGHLVEVRRISTGELVYQWDAALAGAPAGFRFNGRK